jgi:lysophospholipase L1-like esterase
MRSSRILGIGIAALTAALTAAIVGTVTPAKAASSVNYVALGDSYASGVGAGNTSGSCAQSPNAYPALWAAANGASFAFKACTSATTADVIDSQLSALSSSTTLVSVTIGGNDAGFSTIMETCVLESDSACESAINSGVSTAQNTLPSEFATLYSDIKSDAPNAKIVYLDYPDFYDTSVSGCIGLDSTKHTALNNGIDAIDAAFKSAASAGGATFADVRSAFSGHELCDRNAWLHSVNVTDIDESYHPTATGHKDGYLPVFSSAASSVGQ